MKKSLFTNIRTYFREYCSYTSVHGFQYFGEKRRTLFERYNLLSYRGILSRIWWFVVFMCCLAACTVSIYAVYKKWERSPVIVNFANRGTPIYDIPFPAVTICPESKSEQTIFNFTDILHKMEDGENLTSIEQSTFEYMSVVCNYYPELNYTNPFNFSDEFFDVMDKVKPRFMMQNCTFITYDMYCDLIFKPIVTDDGVCYTFNMLDRREIFREDVVHFKDYHTSYFQTSWTLQHGYKKLDDVIDSYPIRAFLSGAKNGFTFNIVTPNQHIDYACKSSLQGYKVLLHTPMTIPRPSLKYFRVPLEQAVVGGIQPVMITTSDIIKAYSPEKRQCYFAEERRLAYFQNYTSSNCNLECLTNSTLEYCHCVDFFMPRNEGTEICGTGSIECMKEVEEELHLCTIIGKLDAETAKKMNKCECDCLPVCSDLTYEVETSQTDWEWNKLLSARRTLPRVKNDSHLSSVTLFFKSDNFITSERNELYGPMDFLANFGGVLGLFTGFSILSLMEILYFLTVRIVCNQRLFGHWAGDSRNDG